MALLPESHLACTGQECRGESRSGCWLDQHGDRQLTHLGTPGPVSSVLTPPCREHQGCLREVGGWALLGTCCVSLRQVAQPF